MATLTVQALATTGTIPTFDAIAAGGDTYSNADRPFVWIKNDGASTCTATIPAQNPCNQGETHDIVVSIPAGSERVIPPVSSAHYADGNDMVDLTYTGTTAGVTIAVVSGA